MAQQITARKQQELQNQYTSYKNGLQQIASKIGDVETEAEEHKLVLETLEPLPGDRKCFRMINEEEQHSGRAAVIASALVTYFGVSALHQQQRWVKSTLACKAVNKEARTCRAILLHNGENNHSSEAPAAEPESWNFMAARASAPNENASS
ncbi:hypothetical protein SS1G_04419 [Sclerotinia sclerotiorum 1980 UF-70]|uniref:Uncharacterized protein n=1 Tax=Sclerotinia sclerotiorum (strain ATCC 18683 / 1980 / Ss-1) TaxID=665079 RepID=A7EGH8_SCLS1|nr:hypothetical protein SS1G_04419 [Sclerotinia sclerotiorum 1980 UF-70]EDO01944.1 hypothetical protein SS1G_04419 [Sclerotinia sclerotiorum 1980 UF-70]